MKIVKIQFYSFYKFVYCCSQQAGNVSKKTGKAVCFLPRYLLFQFMNEKKCLVKSGKDT